MYNSEKTKKKQKTNMKKLFKKHNPPKNGQFQKSKRTQQSDLDIYHHKLRVFATMLDIWT